MITPAQTRNEPARIIGFDVSYIPTCPSNIGLYEHYGYSFVKEITNYGGDNDLLYVKNI